MTGSSQPLVITDFLYRAQDMFGDKQIIDHVDGVETMRYNYRTYTDRVLRLAAALVARGVRLAESALVSCASGPSHPSDAVPFEGPAPVAPPGNGSSPTTISEETPQTWPSRFV